jgi:hypothetical protein
MGYWSVTVYPSRSHTTRPSTTAGKGSLSTVNQGATFSTRSAGSRAYRIFEFSWTRSESTKLGSPNFTAYSSLLKNPPTSTPSLPSYVVV